MCLNQKKSKISLEIIFGHEKAARKWVPHLVQENKNAVSHINE